MIAVDDPDFTLHVGDALEVLATMPDESVHCVVTSPPYWGLRDYGTGSWDGGDDGCDHGRQSAASRESSTLVGSTDTQGGTIAWKDVCGKCGARRVDHQLGLEPTPEEYVTSMVAVFREVRRVLRRDGTCWLNIGDSYATNGTEKGGGNVSETRETGMHGSFKVTPSSLRDRQAALPNQRPPGLKPKDLVGIPWRLAFALQADGWYLRSDIIWSKPNPMPESVTDRPTKAHEYLFLLTRSPRYFYDADAIREPAELRDYASWDERKANGEPPRRGLDAAMRPGNVAGLAPSPAGRNKRSVWEIATEPYPDAHFATFPQALVEPCVLAGTSERGCCPACGAPWERYKPKIGFLIEGREVGGERWNGTGPEPEWVPTCDCGGGQPVPCTVLDPFMGSGTVAVVARRLGRRAVGVELNPGYVALCVERTRQLSLLA